MAEIKVWSVLAEAKAPEGAVAPADIDEAADRFMDHLAHWSGSVSADERGWTARVTVTGSQATDAVAKAAEKVIPEAAAKAGLPEWPVVRLEVVSEDEFELELSRPSFPALYGTSEVTDVLGITRQRLHQLRHGGQFPEPIAEIAAGPVWLRPAIDGFVATWNRTPGRPAAVPGRSS
jgi:hypothetical protein